MKKYYYTKLFSISSVFKVLWRQCWPSRVIWLLVRKPLLVDAANFLRLPAKFPKCFRLRYRTRVPSTHREPTLLLFSTLSITSNSVPLSSHSAGDCYTNITPPSPYSLPFLQSNSAQHSTYFQYSSMQNSLRSAYCNAPSMICSVQDSSVPKHGRDQMQ